MSEYLEDEIICPYCRYEFSDSNEHYEDDESWYIASGIEACPECGEVFKWEREMKPKYNTYEFNHLKSLKRF